MGGRVLVAGAGVSGRSAAEALLADGATVTVTDAAPERLAELTTLAERGVELSRGLAEPPDGTELVVTSPGWRPDSPLLVAAREAGIEVIGEIELAWRLDRARSEPATWLAVTGTNGKTTTVGMLESILRAADIDAVACGNVGLPAVDAVRSGHRVLAVELSSFQLHWSAELAPYAGAVLNLADDHLDWHGSLNAYGNAKGAVYRGNTSSVYNVDDDWSAHLVGVHGGEEPVGFTLDEPASGNLGISDGYLVDRAFGDRSERSHGQQVALVAASEVYPPGPHNVANALAAAALARSCGVSAEAVAVGLRTFEPGAHRAVTVAEADGVRYVDDSKATNPHAAAAALRAHSDVVWIAGGLLKGADVDDLIRTQAERIRAAVLIGRDRELLASAFTRHAPSVPIERIPPDAEDAMLRAVRFAAERAEAGTSVVLAPAAASMDMFTDYAHRGRSFAAAVRTVLGEDATEQRDPDQRDPDQRDSRGG